MADPIGREAAIPNPALSPFSALIGTWRTTGTHPLLPGKTFHGRASFKWTEGGAFLLMRSEIDEPEIPSGIAIFGTDDDTGECSMLYFDERKVSRRYTASFQGREMKWWRNASDISQRFVAVLAEDGRTIDCRGEMSREGKGWEPDLALTYTRIE